jgi:hypothetical protein
MVRAALGGRRTEVSAGATTTQRGRGGTLLNVRVMFERVKTLLFQNALSGLAVALVLVTGCSNVLGSGLVASCSSSFF